MKNQFCCFRTDGRVCPQFERAPDGGTRSPSRQTQRIRRSGDVATGVRSRCGTGVVAPREPPPDTCISAQLPTVATDNIVNVTATIARQGPQRIVEGLVRRLPASGVSFHSVHQGDTIKCLARRCAAGAAVGCAGSRGQSHIRRRRSSAWGCPVPTQPATWGTSYGSNPQ